MDINSLPARDLRNGDDHFTDKSQSCERAMLTEFCVLLYLPVWMMCDVLQLKARVQSNRI